MKKTISFLFITMIICSCALAQSAHISNKAALPKTDAFQSDIEAVFGDTTGFMYQYRSAVIRNSPDTATKLSVLVSAILELEAKYGTPQQIKDEIEDSKRQPWNQTCNIICAGMFWGCKAGCHIRDYEICVKACSNSWEDCARFCNVYFPAWPDLNQ